MNWYRKAQVNKDEVRIPGYPYYIAQYREGRFKGMYPNGIMGIPNMERKWDRGGFGSGRRMEEIKSEDPKEIFDILRRKSIDPRFDDVEYYIVEGPNRPRRRMQLREFIEVGM